MLRRNTKTYRRAVTAALNHIILIKLNFSYLGFIALVYYFLPGIRQRTLSAHGFIICSAPGWR